MGFALNKPRQQAPEDSASFANVAERLRRGGELQRAVSLCRDGLRRFPEHVSARVTLGLALVDLGEFEQAGEALRQALKRAPDNLAAIRGLAHLHDHHDHGDGEDDVPMESVWQPVNEHQPQPRVAAYHRPEEPDDYPEEPDDYLKELTEKLAEAEEEAASVTVAFAAPVPAPVPVQTVTASSAPAIEVEPVRAVAVAPQRVRVRHRDPELQSYFDALPYAPPPAPAFDPFEIEDVIGAAPDNHDDVLDLSGFAESLDAGA